jgi:hypothetical protein
MKSVLTIYLKCIHYIADMGEERGGKEVGHENFAKDKEDRINIVGGGHDDWQSS